MFEEVAIDHIHGMRDGRVLQLLIRSQRLLGRRTDRSRCQTSVQ